jgi:hypothetical protein
LRFTAASVGSQQQLTLVSRSGVPVRASETEGRQGKDGDGKAGTRKVKLARLFTVSGPGPRAGR